MPDTLPIDWTWEMLPAWEREVLQSLGELLKEHGYTTTLAEPVAAEYMQVIEVDYWYGIDVWTGFSWWWPPSWFVKSHVTVIHCSENVLLLGGGKKPRRFDLYDPTSIDKLLRAIK